MTSNNPMGTADDRLQGQRLQPLRHPCRRGLLAMGVGEPALVAQILTMPSHNEEGQLCHGRNARFYGQVRAFGCEDSALSMGGDGAGASTHGLKMPTALFRVR